MGQIKLRHLEVMLVIARTGSLTAAAEQLQVSQPAVSQWLADLEESLKVRLFVRGRRLRPTAYADPVLRHAEHVFEDARRLQEEITAIRGGASGLVRIGTMPVAASAILPSAIRNIRQKHRTLRLVVIEDIAAGLWERFERSELDLVLTRLDEHAIRSGFMRETLYSDHHRIVCGPQHPLVSMHPVAWTQTLEYPWIMPPWPTPLRQAIEVTFRQQGLPVPEVWLDSVSFTTNQLILRDTNTLGVLSHTAAQHLQDLRVLHELPLELITDIGDVTMIWKDPRPGPSLMLVLEAIRAEARHM